ncbi:MAG: hypothetical protein HYS05_12130 [Acidobacteria bacterium]|nr:hypothetical protein [Acidobacteriota bacterium]
MAPDDRRRACEVQAKSHLLHLREGFLECGGRPEEVAHLITRSAAPLAALMRHVTRLGGMDAHSEAFRPILALEASGALAAADALALYPKYLRSVEQFAQALDRWGQTREGS